MFIKFANSFSHVPALTAVSFYQLYKNQLIPDQFVKQKFQFFTPTAFTSLLKGRVYLKKSLLSLASFFSFQKAQPHVQKTNLPRVDVQQAAYDHLSCPKMAEENAAEILSLLANNSWRTLPCYLFRFKSLGAPIKETHPLPILEKILKNPSLKAPLQEILKDENKWWAFVDARGDGFAHHLQRYADQNELMPHLEAFAKRVGADPEILRRYVIDSKWDEMLRHLISTQRQRETQKKLYPDF